MRRWIGRVFLTLLAFAPQTFYVAFVHPRGEGVRFASLPSLAAFVQPPIGTWLHKRRFQRWDTGIRFDEDRLSDHDT